MEVGLRVVRQFYFYFGEGYRTFVLSSWKLHHSVRCSIGNTAHSPVITVWGRRALGSLRGHFVRHINV